MGDRPWHNCAFSGLLRTRLRQRPRQPSCRPSIGVWLAGGECETSRSCSAPYDDSTPPVAVAEQHIDSHRASFMLKANVAITTTVTPNATRGVSGTYVGRRRNLRDIPHSGAAARCT